MPDVEAAIRTSGAQFRLYSYPSLPPISVSAVSLYGLCFAVLDEVTEGDAQSYSINARIQLDSSPWMAA